MLVVDKGEDPGLLTSRIPWPVTEEVDEEGTGEAYKTDSSTLTGGFTTSGELPDGFPKKRFTIPFRAGAYGWTVGI